jgi:hypothetical protein
VFLLSRHPDRLGRVRQQWEQIRGALYNLVRTEPWEASWAILELFLKGEQLFVPGARYRSDEPFAQVQDRALAALPTELQARLVSLAREAWPENERAQASLKSQLVPIVDIRQSKEPLMNRDFVRWLLSHPKADAYVRSTIIEGRSGPWGTETSAAPTSLLEKLLRRDAVGKFEFLFLREGDGAAREENSQLTGAVMA